MVFIHFSSSNLLSHTHSLSLLPSAQWSLMD